MTHKADRAADPRDWKADEFFPDPAEEEGAEFDGECDVCGTLWMFAEQEFCACCGARHNDDGEEEV